MWNGMAIYYYRVSDQPSDPEVFRNLPFQHHNPRDRENFNVNFCVRFQLRCRSGLAHILNIPSPLISSHYISCKCFFQHGPAFLRSNLSHQWLSADVLEILVPRIMSEARRLFMNHPRCRSDVGDRSVIYPLAVDVVVELPEAEEAVSAIERLVWESMQQVRLRMVPASKEAIQSLNAVKLRGNVAADDDANNQNRCCCICLEDFHEGVQVSAMPCHHVYHNDCIVQWLNTSHLCPLCRYPMAVLDNS